MQPRRARSPSPQRHLLAPVRSAHNGPARTTLTGKTTSTPADDDLSAGSPPEAVGADGFSTGTPGAADVVNNATLQLNRSYDIRVRQQHPR